MSIAPETVPQPSLTDVERAAAVRALLEAEPPPMITKSIEAFRRDMPEMLRTRRGWWVAYHGDERIGFGRSKTDLYEECFRRGLTRDDFVVCGVEESTFNPDEEIEFSSDV